MSAGWIVLGIGLAGAMVAVSRWFRRTRDYDLGTLSHQWIAEQRFGQGHDPQR